MGRPAILPEPGMPGHSQPGAQARTLSPSGPRYRDGERIRSAGDPVVA
jgi:hypothetical protein